MNAASKFFGAVLLMVICSCGTPAVITGTWHNPDIAAGNYNNIFVAAIATQITDKKMIETDVQRTLQQMGLTVEKSIDLFPAQTQGQRLDVAISKIAPTGANGILTVTLVRQEKEYRFDPLPAWEPVGDEYIAKYPDKFVNGSYEKFEYDGFYHELMVFYVETKFYSIKDRKLVWEAQSKTYAPNNIEGFVKGFVPRIYDRMQKDGVMAYNQAH